MSVGEDYNQLFLTLVDFKHTDSCQRNPCTGTEDGSHAGLIKEVVILSGDDTACYNNDILAAELLQFLDHLRHKGLVTGCQRRHAKEMHVVLNGLTGGLGRGLEQRAHVDVETAVGITCGHNLCTTVVTVLAHFSYHYTRLTAFSFCEFLCQLLSLEEIGIILCFC